MLGAPVEYLTPQETNLENREPDEVAKSFREAYADFALKLLNESRAVYEGDGLLVSPLSAMIALAMTANGAEENTLTQMEAVLGMDIESLNAYLKSYKDSLPEDEKNKLSIDGGYWKYDAEKGVWTGKGNK